MKVYRWQNGALRHIGHADVKEPADGSDTAAVSFGPLTRGFFMLDYIEELQAALNAVASTYGMTGEEYAKVRVRT